MRPLSSRGGGGGVKTFGATKKKNLFLRLPLRDHTYFSAHPILIGKKLKLFMECTIAWFSYAQNSCFRQNSNLTDTS